MIDGKKEFLKKLCFVLTKGILCVHRVEYNERLVGIKLNRYLGFFFFFTISLKGNEITENNKKNLLLVEKIT